MVNGKTLHWGLGTKGARWYCTGIEPKKEDKVPKMDDIQTNVRHVKMKAKNTHIALCT